MLLGLALTGLPTCLPWFMNIIRINDITMRYLEFFTSHYITINLHHISPNPTVPQHTSSHHISPLRTSPHPAPESTTPPHPHNPITHTPHTTHIRPHQTILYHTAQDITSDHITSHHITSHHITSHHITSHGVACRGWMIPSSSSRRFR